MRINSENISQIMTFLSVVDAGSFTSAARHLGVTQPTVSRHIKSLEERLGTRLLTRSTRVLKLTNEGRQFYEDMSRVFGMLETATSAASAQGMSVSGRLRVGAPVAYGLAQILPRLPKLMEQWPQLDVDLEFSDDTVDLVEDGIEVSIRIGQSRDLSLVSKKIGETRRIAVASPGYLQKFGAPQHPSELQHHQCVIYTRLAHPTKWLFRCPNSETDIVAMVSGRVYVNTSDANKIAAQGGLGIAIVPEWLLGEGPEQLGLTQVLPTFEPEAIPINAIFPSQKLLSSRARTFIDFMASELRGEVKEAV